MPKKAFYLVGIIVLIAAAGLIIYLRPWGEKTPSDQVNAEQSKTPEQNNSSSTLVAKNTAATLARSAYTWKKYEGAWFEISYPSDFTVRESLESETGEGYDSVFFVSPDKQAEFYVFSPQWNGEPRDILPTDKETSFSQEERPGDGSVITSLTIDAKDGSYRREYDDVHQLDYNTRSVTGFKYSNGDVGKQYRADFQKFKSSLIPFGD